jgi:hypothetical protein
MILHFFLLLTTIIISFSAYANPTPLGFVLNNSTISDVEKQYRITVKEQNYWDGNNYYLNVRDAKLDGLRELLVICNDSDVIQAVILTVNQDKFWEYFDFFSEKYEMTEKEIAISEYRKAKFTADQSIIIIESPCLMFDMSIIYITRDFYEKYKKQRAEESTQKAKVKAML